VVEGLLECLLALPWTFIPLGDISLFREKESSPGIYSLAFKDKE